MGFSLVEAMISMSIFGVLSMGLMSGFVFTSKSSFAVGNYADLVQSGTMFLETFARDVRMAGDVHTATATELTIDVNYSNGIKTVSYILNPDYKTLIRTESGTSKIVLSDIDQLSFNYFNILGNSTTSLLEAKTIQVEAILEKRVIQQKNTDHVVSARYMMRNRIVSN